MKPVRTCIVCREKFNKDKLYRFVKLEEQIVLDKTKKSQARGVYVCKNEECINKIEKKKAFNRAFRSNLSQETYNKILNQIKGQG